MWPTALLHRVAQLGLGLVVAVEVAALGAAMPPFSARYSSPPEATSAEMPSAASSSNTAVQGNALLAYTTSKWSVRARKASMYARARVRMSSSA